MIIKDLFTSLGIYNLRTKISMFIFASAPILLEWYFLFPAAQTLPSTLIVALVVYSISNIIIIYSRFLRTRAMKKCFPDLLPAQQALLFSSTFIKEPTKQRYYDFLTEHVSGFQVYEDDEKMRPIASSAISWLISQTRDINQFPLIAEENINFGSSYNLLGMKKYSITFLILCIALNILLLTPYVREFVNFNQLTIIALIVADILFLTIWILIVTKNLVINCGKKYAYALLSACDSPDLL